MACWILACHIPNIPIDVGFVNWVESDIVAERFTNKNFGAVSIEPAYVALVTMVSKAGFSFLPLAEMFREWTQSNQKVHDKIFAKTFTGTNDSFVIVYPPGFRI